MTTAPDDDGRQADIGDAWDRPEEAREDDRRRRRNEEEEA